MDCTTLDEVRENIDRIDNSIVKLIAERQQYVLQAASFKKNTHEVKAPNRVEAVINKSRQKAEHYGADPDVVANIYREMIKNFVNLETAKFKNKE